MSRSRGSGQLDTRTDRLQLKARTSPYWVVLEKGRALGNRKGLKGGTWIARFHDSAAQRVCTSLGAADEIPLAEPAGMSDYPVLIVREAFQVPDTAYLTGQSGR